MRKPGVASLVSMACLVGTMAFVTYSRTLLPGVDFGDTGAFQAAVTAREISVRQAYPLYYTLARPFVGATAPRNPARALNLFSAVWGALAVGALVASCAWVTRSLAAGAVGGLLLAFSYTFWTQAIIAEVYTLHLAMVAACLVALAAYAERPSRTRLAIFFAMYALGFGNHLSMILLAVPFTVFLLMTTADKRSLFRPEVILMAAGIAIAGALQYLPPLLAVWNAADAFAGWTGRLAAFWFEVTMADWRESLVLGVRAGQARDRVAMFWFDARQQVGTIGLLLAVIGAWRLWRSSRPWAAAVVLAYVINTCFAITYNVGDPHVFLLPGHLFVAFLAGASIAPVAAGSRLRTVRVAAAALAVGYAAWRAYDTWPAADRHDDHRAELVVERMTVGLDERHALLAARVNWQVESALLYDTRVTRRHVAWVRLTDVMLHFPLLVEDNQAIGRDIVLTPAAAADLTRAFGSLLTVVPDDTIPTISLWQVVERIPRGAPYVLAVLAPPRSDEDQELDQSQLASALRTLTGGRVRQRVRGPYEVWAGQAGSPPAFYRGSSSPFREQLRLEDADIDIRMESWLPVETFRRGGFGHVIRNRRHVLALERGVSLIWFTRSGEPSQPVYAAGLYAPQPRFRIPAAEAPQVARQALGVGSCGVGSYVAC